MGLVESGRAKAKASRGAAVSTRNSPIRSIVNIRKLPPENRDVRNKTGNEHGTMC